MCSSPVVFMWRFQFIGSVHDSLAKTGSRLHACIVFDVRRVVRMRSELLDWIRGEANYARDHAAVDAS